MFWLIERSRPRIFVCMAARSFDHLHIGEDLIWPSQAMPGATRQKIKDADQDEMNEIFSQHTESWTNLGEYETLGRNSLPCCTSLGERFDFLNKLLHVVLNGEVMPNQAKRAIIKVLCKQPQLNKSNYKNDLYAGYRTSRIVVMLYHIRTVTRYDNKFEEAAKACTGAELKMLSQLCDAMKLSIQKVEDDSSAFRERTPEPRLSPRSEDDGDGNSVASAHRLPRGSPQSLSPHHDEGKDGDEEDAVSEAPSGHSRVLSDRQKSSLLEQMGISIEDPEDDEDDQKDNDRKSASAAASASTSSPKTPSKTPSTTAAKSSAKDADGVKKDKKTETSKTQQNSPEKKVKADPGVIKQEFIYRKEFYKKCPIGFGFKRFRAGDNKHGKHLFHLRSNVLTRTKLEELAEKVLNSFKNIKSTDSLAKRERSEAEIRVLASHKMARYEAMKTAEDVW